MKFKVISSIAIAAVSVAAFAFVSTAYGFAESFASACVIMMLPLAFEPLGRANRLFAETGKASTVEPALVRPTFRELAGTGARGLVAHRQAA